MTRPRGEGGAKFVVREQRKRDRLREETQGLADCGRASNGRYSAGCRCDACKAARSAYERGRVRAETLYKFMLAKPGLDEMRKSG